MIKRILPFLAVLFFTGCYTQFATLDNDSQSNTIPPDSVVAANDSTHSSVRTTLSINDNQVCYWTRDLWGRPELRCNDSYYGRDWYSYNYYPWWNRSSSYYYGSYNYYGYNQRCPAFYYYDYSCGMCRYYTGYSGYRDNQWWWDSPGRYYGGRSNNRSYDNSSGSYSSQKSLPSKSEVAYPASQPLQKQSNLNSVVAPSEIISSKATTSTGSSSSSRRSRSEGIPSAAEINTQPTVNLPSARELPKQTAPDPVPQQSVQQPQSPPPQQNTAPSNNGGGNNNSSGSSGGHRSSRGW